MSEKRILVTECNGDCRNLRFVRKDDFFDDPYIEEGFYCVADIGRVESIDPKQCENCKKQYFTGLTKEEVIDIMAKAMCEWDTDEEDCGECACKGDESACKCFVDDSGYIKQAEFVLNALLGKK